MGSLAFMAPELLKVNSTYDGTIDSWALGVILYELLVFKSPFYGNSDQELVTQIFQKKLDFVEDRAWASISIEARDLTENLL